MIVCNSVADHTSAGADAMQLGATCKTAAGTGKFYVMYCGANVVCVCPAVYIISCSLTVLLWY